MRFQGDVLRIISPAIATIMTPITTKLAYIEIPLRVRLSTGAAGFGLARRELDGFEHAVVVIATANHDRLESDENGDGPPFEPCLSGAGSK